MVSNNVNDEYVRVFGEETRPTLFDSDDESYNALRQNIMDSSVISLKTGRLPFEEVTSHLMYIREKRIDDKNNALSRIQESIENQHYASNTLSRTNNNLKQKTKENQIYVNGMLGQLMTALIQNAKTEKHQHVQVETKKHIYWLLEEGRCRAYGFFDVSNNSFYIGANSLISDKDNPEYLNTSSYRSRQRIIQKFGQRVNGYIRLNKDVKCRSSASAACYVLGRMAYSHSWIEKY